MSEVIGLKGPWLDLVEDCRSLGPVGLYNRNHAASLTTVGVIPRLENLEDNCAADDSGDLMVDFGQWRRVQARRIGIHREISVLDPSCRQCFGVQSTCGTQHALLDQVLSRYHKRTDGLAQDPAASSLAPWNEEFHRRIDRLQSLTTPYRPTPVQLESLFQTALELQFPMRVATMNRVACLRSTARFSRVIRRSDHIRVESAEVVLEFEPRQAATAWIVEEPAISYDETQWSLEFYDHDGFFCLSLRASNDEHEMLWQETLARTIPCELNC